jgi:transcriptional regulator GlxA family with amidase domain
MDAPGAAWPAVPTLDDDAIGGYDKTMSKTAIRRNVVFVLYDGIQLLDVAGAAEVFAQASPLTGGIGYDVHFVGAAGLLRSSAGLMLSGVPFSSAPKVIHTLVVPGAVEMPLRRAIADPALMKWLARAARRATRIASVCSGAFLLGALGLLDGRRATTHWSAVEQLAAIFPRTTVDREALFVEDGKVWTSAGVTTGIDLALALVSRDMGPDVALSVARMLVLHLVRPGGQSQFSAPLTLQARASADLTRFVPWLEARLERDITVEGMASAMGMSERSFHRRCMAAFGMAPGKLLAELRFDRARTLLGDPTVPVRSVAARSGFSDPTAFSKAFTRRFGASPTSYRRAFAQAGLDEARFKQTTTSPELKRRSYEPPYTKS